MRHVETGTSARAHLVMAAKLLSVPPDVKGVIVEAGSWKGGTTANLSIIADLVGRDLIVYDSFEGLPAPADGDRWASQFGEGAFRGELDEVRANVAAHGVIERCEFRKGWFSETMPGHREPIVAAFVDVDRQSSMHECLLGLWPHLVDRGYLFIDEYIRLDYCAVFFSERYWRTYFDRPPPGLLGAGTGVAVGQVFPGPARAPAPSWTRRAWASPARTTTARGTTSRPATSPRSRRARRRRRPGGLVHHHLAGRRAGRGSVRRARRLRRRDADGASRRRSRRPRTDDASWPRRSSATPRARTDQPPANQGGAPWTPSTSMAFESPTSASGKGRRSSSSTATSVTVPRRGSRSSTRSADELTLVAWDAPGAGGSSDPPEDIGMAGYADCLAGFIRELGLDSPHVVGLSFGGALAIELQRRHRVAASLTLVSAYAGWRGSLGAAAAEQRLDQALALSELAPAGPRRHPPADDVLGADAPAVVSVFGRSLLAVRPVGFRAMARASAEDLRDALPSIDVPTLLVYGGDDVRAPMPVAEAMHEAIAGSTLVVLPGAGHVCNLEQPDQFNALVRSFLAETRARRRRGR